MISNINFLHKIQTYVNFSSNFNSALYKLFCNLFIIWLLILNLIISLIEIPLMFKAAQILVGRVIPIILIVGRPRQKYLKFESKLGT